MSRSGERQIDRVWYRDDPQQDDQTKQPEQANTTSHNIPATDNSQATQERAKPPVESNKPIITPLQNNETSSETRFYERAKNLEESNTSIQKNNETSLETGLANNNTVTQDNSAVFSGNASHGISNDSGISNTLLAPLTSDSHDGDLMQIKHSNSTFTPDNTHGTDTHTSGFDRTSSQVNDWYQDYVDPAQLNTGAFTHLNTTDSHKTAATHETVSDSGGPERPVPPLPIPNNTWYQSYLE